MKLRNCILFFILFLATKYCYSGNYTTTCDSIPDSLTLNVNVFHDTLKPVADSLITKNQSVKPKRRVFAALLCLTLGPFGMHRLYLGTQPHVAAAYTLTLGGGLGLVTVIDLFQIVFTKDISRFKDNDQFIMWKK